MDLDPAAVEAALEVERQYTTNGLCHFGANCDGCDCFYKPGTEWDDQERERMRRIAAVIARATADAIADKIADERAKAWLAGAAKHGTWVGLRGAFNTSERIARSHGSQAQTTEDGQ
jgi:hypothetical protein